MKRAKLMLSALAIFAVLGSAFAVDAKHFTLHFIYTGAITQPGSATACDERVNGAAISNGTANVRASTASLTISCPQVFTVGVLDTP